MKFKLSCCVLVAGMTAVSLSAFAALGENVQAVANDAKTIRAVSLVSRSAPYTSSSSTYTKHEMSLAGGGSVVEYTNANDIVFALSWQSPLGAPNLSLLLGNYIDAFGRAQAQSRTGKWRSLHHLNATEGDWSVVSEIRNHAFNGFSYLRSQLPAGFNLQLLSQ